MFQLKEFIKSLEIAVQSFYVFKFDGRMLFEMDPRMPDDVLIAAEIDFEQLPRSGRNYYFLNVTVWVCTTKRTCESVSSVALTITAHDQTQ